MDRSDGIYLLAFGLGALRLVIALVTAETFGAEASIAAALTLAGLIGWLHDRRLSNLDAVLMRRGGRPRRRRRRPHAANRHPVVARAHR